MRSSEGPGGCAETSRNRTFLGNKSKKAGEQMGNKKHALELDETRPFQINLD